MTASTSPKKTRNKPQGYSLKYLFLWASCPDHSINTISPSPSAHIPSGLWSLTDVVCSPYLSPSERDRILRDEHTQCEPGFAPLQTGLAPALLSAEGHSPNTTETPSTAFWWWSEVAEVSLTSSHGHLAVTFSSAQHKLRSQFSPQMPLLTPISIPIATRSLQQVLRCLQQSCLRWHGEPDVHRQVASCFAPILLKASPGTPTDLYPSSRFAQMNRIWLQCMPIGSAYINKNPIAIWLFSMELSDLLYQKFNFSNIFLETKLFLHPVKQLNCLF